MPLFAATRHVLLAVLLVFGISLCLPARASPAAAEAAITVGQRLTLKSAVLGEDRQLLIHLPEDYARSKQRYPVLFILDGGAHFDYATGLVDFLARNGRTSPLILVAVPSMQKRWRDMSQRSGGAGNFLRFLADELAPWVDAHYRTQPFRILSGHSFGGQFSFYALLERPDAFQAFIVPSPSLYGGTDEYQRTKQRIGTLPGKHWLYFSSGDYDSLDDHEYRTLDGVQRLTNWLRQRKFEHLEWTSRHYPGDDHGTTPFRTLYDGLQWLYKDWRALTNADFGLDIDDIQHITSDEANQTRQALKEVPHAELERRIAAHYARISRIYGYTVEPGLDGGSWKRRWLSMHGRYDEAVANARATLISYPEHSVSLHEAISGLLERQGRFPEALAEYRKALSEHQRFPDPWWSEFGNDAEREQRLKELEEKATGQEKQDE